MSITPHKSRGLIPEILKNICSKLIFDRKFIYRLFYLFYSFILFGVKIQQNFTENFVTILQ